MKLMILDGNSVINRAYYGVRPLSTRDGLYTHAIYGFLNILERMRSEEQPDALCVAFDLHGPTFRHERYSEYKATRHGMDPELAAQMPVMKDVLRAMNIPIYECQGWEADDVIGTVSKICSDAAWECVIVTGDRDDLQLIDRHVTVKYISSRMGQTNTVLYDEARFTEEYGFAPIHLIDLKSLMGDSSDNIPGVPGIGQKTATELLHQFACMEDIYDALEEAPLKDSVKKKLRNGRESAVLSYDLATIRKDAPISFAPEDCLLRPVREEELYDLFVRLEFSKLIERYGLKKHKTEKPAAEKKAFLPPETVLLREKAQWEDFLRESAGSVLSVSLLPDLSGVAVVAAGKAGVAYAGQCAEYDALLRELFGSGYEKTGHGVKEIMHSLLQAGMPAEGFVFDTELAAYFLDPSVGSYELEKLAAVYAEVEFAEEKASQQISFYEEETNDAATVWAEKTAVIGYLREIFDPELERLGMRELYYGTDLPLCRVLAEMEVDGIAIDKEALLAFGTMLRERIAQTEAAIFRYAGHSFNVNSTRELGKVLFDELALPALKKTKTGYSTNAEVLEQLRYHHPIVEQVMDYRMLTKLNATYAEGLLKEIRSDGRIHTTFQNTVTATGRLSSTAPNLQNIPVRTELGSEFRKMFVARPGWVMVDADYSQIELRVLAHMAADRLMIDAFRDNADIHTITASQVFGIAPEDVTPEMRRRAKAVNFGMVYGISEFSLADDIGVNRYEAKRYMETYFSRYAGVAAYQKKIVAEARENGFVSTLYGRRRSLPDIRNSNFHIRSGAERIAMNTPIQGTAADIIKMAMNRTRDALQGMEARLVLQIHDELLVECPEEEAEEVRRRMTEAMQNAVSLSVQLIAEAKTGKSWYETK